MCVFIQDHGHKTHLTYLFVSYLKMCLYMICKVFSCFSHAKIFKQIYFKRETEPVLTVWNLYYVGYFHLPSSLKKNNRDDCFFLFSQKEKNKRCLKEKLAKITQLLQSTFIYWKNSGGGLSPNRGWSVFTALSFLGHLSSHNRVWISTVLRVWLQQTHLSNFWPMKSLSLSLTRTVRELSCI